MTAVLVAAALAAYPAAQDLDLQLLALGLGAIALALLVASLVVNSAAAVGWALAALGTEYALLFMAQGRRLDELAPVYAAGFLFVAEVAFWSIERRVSTSVEPGLLERRLVFLASACAGAAFVAAFVLVLAAAGGGGIALDAAGAVAAVGVLGVIVLLGRRAARAF